MVRGGSVSLCYLTHQEGTARGKVSMQHINSDSYCQKENKIVKKEKVIKPEWYFPNEISPMQCFMS